MILPFFTIVDCKTDKLSAHLKMPTSWHAFSLSHSVTQLPPGGSLTLLPRGNLFPDNYFFDPRSPGPLREGAGTRSVTGGEGEPENQCRCLERSPFFVDKTVGLWYNDPTVLL